MDKLLKLLGADKLDESAQGEIKTKLQDIIDLKAKEMSESKITEAKDQLVEDYESKFNEYKDEITSKFSNFVDSVIDEEMVIPDKILEYAKKGELYHELIEQFKVRLALDEGMLDAEVKGLLKEAKDEIMQLRGSLDEKTAKELDTELDNQRMAAELHLRKKTDGLTEAQKSHVFNMLEDIIDIEEIDRKFDLVVEKAEEKAKDDDDDEDDEKKKKDDDEDDEKKKKDIKEDDEEDDDDDDKKGKGKSEVKDDDDDDDKKKKVDESGPFAAYVKKYVSTLKANKI